MELSRTQTALANILLVVLILFVGIKAWNGSSEHGTIGKVPHQRDTVSVEGMGKIEATPDVAVLSIGLYSEGASVKQIQKDNSEKVNAIIKTMGALGVEKKDIATSGYSIAPRFDWRDGRQLLNGYTVSQQVTVKVRDLDTVGDVLAKAGELGANQVSGVNFQIDDPKKLQADAREKAIADAREKAEMLVKQLGISLGRVVTFSESNGGMPTPYPIMAKAMDMRAEAGSVAPQIEPGTHEVVSNVSVTFEVN